MSAIFIRHDEVCFAKATNEYLREGPVDLVEGGGGVEEFVKKEKCRALKGY